VTARVERLALADPLAEADLQGELARKYFVWDAFVGGERRVDIHPLVLSRRLHDDAVLAAENVVRLVGAAAARSHADPEEAARYGLHSDVLRLAAASHSKGDDAGLVRVDLLLGDDGVWRSCEINADCPGGHNEAFALPRLARAAGYSRGRNPTILMRALASRIEELATDADGKRGAVGLIFATVCAFVKRALEERGIKAILAPPTAPRYRNGKLMIGSTEIRALYRYSPAEYMEGQSNVPDLVEAILAGKVRTISSFSQIFMQSKLAFARAWSGAAERFSPADSALLAAHVPATFEVCEIDPARLAIERNDWVIKRALGRVGDEVFVGSLTAPADWGPLIADVRARVAKGETWIAQRFIPQRAIATPWGPRLVTLGAYVLDGSFVGYFARLTRDSHVSHDALVLPVFHDHEDRAASERVEDRSSEGVAA
jgi:Glutathionylspermidine synthase preATP-grasp